ncbi:MAG: DUF4410 domain-containing protein [Terriglobales bacterium]
MLNASVSARDWLRSLGTFWLAAYLAYSAMAGADTRSIFVDVQEDHSGKAIEAEVLTSLHDELATALGKSGKVVAKPEAQVLVHVEVVDFHMRNQASRWMLGAMSGKDYITSKVSLIDASNNATLSTTEVKTSTANQYRGQDSIARMHADEIAKALSDAK